MFFLLLVILVQLLVTFTIALTRIDGISHTDKFSGIQILLKEWGLSKSQHMAFDDSNSDLSMLINAGIGASMQNATNELKKAADDQCDICQNHGVEKYLSNYFHLNQKINMNDHVHCTACKSLSFFFFIDQLLQSKDR